MISATGRISSFGKGITFIELFLVLIIITVLAAIAIPQFNNTFPSLALKTFSLDLKNFIEYLRARSIAEARLIELEINNANKQYWAKFEGEIRHLKDYSIPAGIKVEAEKVINFYPDGSIDDFKIILVNKRGESITLSAKGALSEIKISP
jgi:type II secretory pathway pseudopilin PulG